MSVNEDSLADKVDGPASRVLRGDAGPGFVGRGFVAASPENHPAIHVYDSAEDLVRDAPPAFAVGPITEVLVVALARGPAPRLSQTEEDGA